MSTDFAAWARKNLDTPLAPWQLHFAEAVARGDEITVAPRRAGKQHVRAVLQLWRQESLVTKPRPR